MQLPNQYKDASRLVGAAHQNITHEELAESYLHPRRYAEGWIYRDPELQTVNLTPSEFIDQAPLKFRTLFFPECSDMDTLAYDCLAKTINQALGFMFFSKRE